MEDLFEELITAQQEKLMQCGQRIVPHLTTDDLLQPNDFPALENHPHFRYEEGLLAGLMTARMAYLARLREAREDGNKQEGISKRE